MDRVGGMVGMVGGVGRMGGKRKEERVRKGLDGGREGAGSN